jgi:hypothetical protein
MARKTWPGKHLDNTRRKILERVIFDFSGKSTCIKEETIEIQGYLLRSRSFLILGSSIRPISIHTSRPKA